MFQDITVEMIQVYSSVLSTHRTIRSHVAWIILLTTPDERGCSSATVQKSEDVILLRGEIGAGCNSHISTIVPRVPWASLATALIYGGTDLQQLLPHHTCWPIKRSFSSFTILKTSTGVNSEKSTIHWILEERPERNKKNDPVLAGGAQWPLPSAHAIDTGRVSPCATVQIHCLS